jgi:hypothetical protein
MSHTARGFLLIYCLLLAGCVLWVPWHVQLRGTEYSRYAGFENMGYGWLWRGPAVPPGWYVLYAAPDVTRISLRVFAVTSVCAAFYFGLGFVSGFRRNSRR